MIYTGNFRHNDHNSAQWMQLSQKISPAFFFAIPCEPPRNARSVGARSATAAEAFARGTPQSTANCQGAIFKRAIV